MAKYRSICFILICFILILFIIISAICFVFFGKIFPEGTSKENVLPQRYIYPAEFSSPIISERVEECRIPEERLSEMTVEELVWAVIDFPFLVDVESGATKNWAYALECLEKKSDAFAALAACHRPEREIIQVLKTEEKTAEAERQGIVKLAQVVFYHAQGTYFNFTKKQMKVLDSMLNRN